LVYYRIVRYYNYICFFTHFFYKNSNSREKSKIYNSIKIFIAGRSYDDWEAIFLAKKNNVKREQLDERYYYHFDNNNIHNNNNNNNNNNNRYFIISRINRQKSRTYLK
jgi:hypothetical protein